MKQINWSKASISHPITIATLEDVPINITPEIEANARMVL